MSQGSMRWPAASPLPDNDDMLREILIHLPPLPSSLPRASLVCKHWRRLLSDPRFLRRFRALNHQNPTLLGFFDDIDGPYFTPTLDPPDRIPSARLSLPHPRAERWSFLGCRHGLALLLNETRLEFTVWDPVTGDQRRVVLPPELFSSGDGKTVLSGALLCGDDHYAGRAPLEAFKVVVLWSDDNFLVDDDTQLYASLYQSETGVWRDLISASIAIPLELLVPSVLIGNSLYWLLLRYENHGNGGILELDLDKQSLAVRYPFGAHTTRNSCMWIVRMEDAGLGFAIASDLSYSIQLWERKTNSNDRAGWMLQKTIELDKLLPPRSPEPTSRTFIHGYDEDGDVIFISTDLQVYMIQLKSLQFSNLSTTNFVSIYYPYRSLYASGRCIGSGDVEVGTLSNA
ncbi:hypothetical protein ACP70R_009275 [Stipagrostis hirtigluma subsp. patula]